MNRYFKATVIDGRLLVSGNSVGEKWDAARLVYWSAENLDRFAPMAAAESKIHTVEELEAALRSDHQPLTLWLAEGLEDEARRRGPRSSPPITRS